MREDRINRLSERFRAHAGGRPPTSERNRQRHSLYIDTALVERLDRAYRQIQHDIYPREITKSAFLEALMEYGLDNLDSIAAIHSDN